MRILVTGVNGQLGHDVINELDRRGHVVIGSDITEEYAGLSDGSAVCEAPYVRLDLTDEKAVRRAIRLIRPQAVIHPAAWTAVDKAEDPAVKDLVWDINAKAPGYLASACARVGAKMLHISTDYVFNGQGEAPWDPDCKEYAPISVYGASKLGGELAVAENLDKFFIVRIAWAFGKNGQNFVKTMLRLADTHPELRVVRDQIGTPTYTLDLARLLADMIESERYGYYHATNEGGYISWADFAREIFRQAEKEVKVIPVTTEEYGLSAAARPFNSRLDKSKLIRAGFTPLPDWQDALHRYLQEIEVIH
ncbi:MAG: dTDP-4-dehydrorhamnose reductase [Lachnospiraceae bacterium]|nr:dTDP-4-dehydrorhamnose reductase [Lachnospiraceae bacterium]